MASCASLRCRCAPLILLLAGCHAAAPPLPQTSAYGAFGLDVETPHVFAIGAVQGRGPRSPMVERWVSVQGLVVGDFSEGLHGVFVQSEKDDGDALTSEGIFVERSAAAVPRLAQGDRVQVSGQVEEIGDGQDTLTALRRSVVRVLGRGVPAPFLVMRAPTESADLERLEGMSLVIAAPLTVTGNDSVSSYGELQSSFEGRLFQPTEVATPGAQASRVAADNLRRRLSIDDGRSGQNLRDPWYLGAGLGPRWPMRAGSVLRNTAGVLDQRNGRYLLQLTKVLEVRQAPRPTVPKVGGSLRIASLNLLNLFNGDGRGGGFPTPRGAGTMEQYLRQQGKQVAVIQALAPDIAALMEVENDGSDADSTLAQLVLALNMAGPVRDYALIDTGMGPGHDAIRVAMIFRSSRVSTIKTPATLAGGPFNGHSRVPLAQAFRVGDGPVFVVATNHFKSKGCGQPPQQAIGADADQHDGQGCWNATRIESARRVRDWLASDPTRTGSTLTLIIGDLNANAMEDPLRLLYAAGWQDAFALLRVPHPYSFVFDGQAGRLDHALLDAGFASRLRGVAEWHNNCDEAPAFDYHLAAGTDAQAEPYRASDHDPILLGFDLAAQPL